MDYVREVVYFVAALYSLMKHESEGNYPSLDCGLLTFLMIWFPQVTCYYFTVSRQSAIHFLQLFAENSLTIEHKSSHLTCYHFQFLLLKGIL